MNTSYTIPNLEFWITGRSADGPTMEWLYLWGGGIAKDVHVGTTYGYGDKLVNSVTTTLLLKDIKPVSYTSPVLTLEKVQHTGPTLAGKLAAQIIKQLGQGYDSEEGRLVLEDAIMKVITGKGS